MDIKEVYSAYQQVREGKKENLVVEKKECCAECGSYDHKTEDCTEVTQEAIEFAADYFLEEGINEEELDIIIEDVGLDDFIEFVHEERFARKARASAPSYAKVKASVDASDAAKKKAKKGEYSSAYKKKETDVTVYDDKPAKVSVKKVKKSVAKAKVAKKDFDGDGKKESPKAEYKGSKDKAIKKAIAAKKAPEKKAGLGDKIRGALKKGVERHKAARAKGKVPEKRVKEFGKGFASGVKDTVKFAGKVKKAVVGETLLALLDTLEEGAKLDKFDAVLAYLIDEEIAEDFDGANEVMIKLNESLVDEIFEQQKKLIAWDNYSSRLVWEELESITEISSGKLLDASRASEVARGKKASAGDKEGASKEVKRSSKFFHAALAKVKSKEQQMKTKSEGYQRNPEKGEAEERKRSKKVRGERTPMPPRGDKRREDFERWYAANVR